MGRFGIWEVLVILAIAALVFGGKRLPELGRGLGAGLANFKEALKSKPDETDAGDSRNS